MRTAALERDRKLRSAGMIRLLTPVSGASHVADRRPSAAPS
ncbi:Unknown protein sequence [Pseudomonas amygdali pv. lachrymans]|nr:Unknown protein sequence [Pseudomonas amygdali pv. lachrymans]